MILTALNNYYGRLVEQGNPDVPPYGYSPENISYCLVIDREGALIDVVSLLDTTEKKPRPSVYLVPQPPKRASNVAPCFLWDKSSYVLGLTSSEKDKDIHRARQTHEKFKEYHRHWLEGEDDVGLQALLAFLYLLTHWIPIWFSDSMKSWFFCISVMGQKRFEIDNWHRRISKRKPVW
jgi:CRISPR-associated protein Csd1